MLQGRPRSGPRRRRRPRLPLPPDPPPRPLRLPRERVPNRRALLLLQRFRAPRRRRFLYGILPRSVFSCFMFLSFAFRVSLSSDVFCFLVLGNVAEARALPPLRSNTNTTLTEPGSGDALTPPHDEPGRVSGPDVVVSHPTSASAQAPVCSLGGLLLVATVSFLLTGYIYCY
ncbi:unnamed protein product [Musa hybrid cultivar]